MSIFPDGSLIRLSDQAEVWQIKGGQRHWVPDEATVGSLGGWNAVQVIQAGQTIDNPLGPMIPSVIQPQAWADLVDGNGIGVPGGQSPLFRYGVDGTVIGNSKRTDAWSFSLDPASGPLVRSLYIFHVWAPNSFQVILDKWAAAAKPISDLIQDATTVAKAIAAA